MRAVVVLALLMASSLLPLAGAGAETPSGPGPTSDPGETTRLAPFQDPEWAPGMQWKYSAVIRMSQGGTDSIDLHGNMSTDTLSWSNVSFGNKTYPSLKIQNGGSGTAKGSMGGFPIDGTWTIAGVVHAARNSTDELQVEQSLVMRNTQPPATITSYQVSNYTPALRNLMFPLDAGKSWSHQGLEERHNWTLLETPLGKQWIAAPNSTVVNFTADFKTSGPVYKLVPAGTFLTIHVANGTMMRIREAGDEIARGLFSLSRALGSPSPLDQPFGNITDQYYSDAAGNSVQLVMRENNTDAGFINLTSTNYKMKQPKYGALGGLVKDSTGNGIKGARVTAAPTSGPGATTWTDSAGRYDFTNLLPGGYTVTGNLSGYVDDSKTGAVAVGQATELNLTLLAPTGKLSVTAKDDAAAALGNVSVRTQGIGIDRTDATDAAGVLRLDLPVGKYDLTATKTGYAPNVTKGVEVKLAAETPVTLQLAKLRGSISGKVTDSAKGLAVAGAKVVAMLGGNAVKETITDAAGGYKVDKLEPARYDVVVTKDGYQEGSAGVDVVAGADKKQNFILRPVEGQPPGGPAGDATLGILIGALVVAAALGAAAFLVMRRKREAREREMRSHEAAEAKPKPKPSPKPAGKSPVRKAIEDREEK